MHTGISENFKVKNGLKRVIRYSFLFNLVLKYTVPRDRKQDVSLPQVGGLSAFRGG